MRGTPYTNLSITEKIAKDRFYKKHLQNVHTIQPEIVSEQLIANSDHLFNSYNQKFIASKNYKQTMKNISQDSEHYRLIEKFSQINQGRHLSVGRAEFQKNMVYSPVAEHHSVNQTARKLYLRDIDRQNGLIKKALEKPNNTVRNKDLKKRWKQQQELQNLIRKSAKPPVSQILNTREQYLDKIKTSQNKLGSVKSSTNEIEIPQKQVKFQNENKSATPIKEEKILDYLNDVKNRALKAQLPTSSKRELLKKSSNRSFGSNTSSQKKLKNNFSFQGNFEKYLKLVKQTPAGQAISTSQELSKNLSQQNFNHTASIQQFEDPSSPNKVSRTIQEASAYYKTQQIQQSNTKKQNKQKDRYKKIYNKQAVQILSKKKEKDDNFSWTNPGDTYGKSTQISRNAKQKHLMTLPGCDGISSQSKLNVSANFDGFDTSYYKGMKLEQIIHDQTNRSTELREPEKSMLPPIEMGNTWKQKLLQVPSPRKKLSEPIDRQKRLEKLNDPYAGDIPALPKFDGVLAMRHFQNVDAKKITKVPSKNNVGFYMHKDSIQLMNSPIINSTSQVDLSDHVWKMDVGSPQIVQRHQKNLEYQAKALLANKRSIFHPDEKRASNQRLSQRNLLKVESSMKLGSSSPLLPQVVLVDSMTNGTAEKTNDN